MKNKYMPCLILCVIALIGYLFMPYVSAFGYEMSIMDAISESNGLGEGPGTVAVLVTIAGGIVGIVASLMKKKGLAVIGSIAGAAGIVIMLLEMSDTLGVGVGDLMDYLGSAIWVGLIGFIVAAILAGNVKETAE